MIDITRGRMAAYLHDERAEEVPPADAAMFEAYARDSREPNQIGLVAWYDYKRRDFRNALEWFKAAIENGGDAMIAHGLAHTLRALDKMREAEEVAFAWRGPLVNNGILFIDLLERDLTREVPPYIEADRLARYARATMEMSSGEGAQGLRLVRLQQLSVRCRLVLVPARQRMVAQGRDRIWLRADAASAEAGQAFLRTGQSL